MKGIQVKNIVIVTIVAVDDEFLFGVKDDKTGKLKKQNGKKKKKAKLLPLGRSGSSSNSLDC